GLKDPFTATPGQPIAPQQFWRTVGIPLRSAPHSFAPGRIPSAGPVGGGSVRLARGAPVGRAVLDQQTIHLVDAQSETDEYPQGNAIARRLGFRTMLDVPLVGAVDRAVDLSGTEAGSYSTSVRRPGLLNSANQRDSGDRQAGQRPLQLVRDRYWVRHS